jgi:putative CocE/NonD family hydrolase
LVVDRNLAVPMRDGVVLRADVYRPKTKASVPAIVYRTPYDRSSPLIPLAAVDPERAAEAGFALVVQDVRGRYGSDGSFYTFSHEGRDGFDTIEWVAAQPWCDGAVGMAGRSYGGAVQWLTALEQPPHLQAIAPVVIGADFFHNWVYQGGAFQLGFNLFWALLMFAPKESRRPGPHYRHLPLRELPILREIPEARFYFDWLEHSRYDDYWAELAVAPRHARVRVPALNVGGWYDVFLGGTLENYAGMRRSGGSEEARTGQRLLVGPWAHGSTYGPYPDHRFEAFAGNDTVDLDELQLSFFGAHLRSEHGGEDNTPVRIFVMGENRWRDEEDWPLARARAEPWFLREGGLLSPEGPDQEGPDEYLYDPHDPSPTVGGPTSLPAPMFRTNAGPLDQRPVEQREDVLVYTSEPLREPLEATGLLLVVLYAATTAPDTDFVAKLSDVGPDGFSRILAEGILRARFRDGYEREVTTVPGRPYEYRIDLVATSNVFGAGHRVRLAVTSSSFPRFDRNGNSGKPLGTDRDEDLRPARQTIFHDADRPSRLLLPVVSG